MNKVVLCFIIISGVLVVTLGVVSLLYIRRELFQDYKNISISNIFDKKVDDFLAHGSVPLNPNVPIVSCSTSRIPSSTYPPGYKDFKGVEQIEGIELSKTDDPTPFSLSREGDVVLWIAGLVPLKPCTFTISKGSHSWKFSYTADKDGRVFLAEKPFPIVLLPYSNVQFGQSSLTSSESPGPTGEIFGHIISPYKADLVVDLSCQKKCAALTPAMQKLKACKVSILAGNNILMGGCENCSDHNSPRKLWAVYGILDDKSRSTLQSTMGNSIKLLDHEQSTLSLPPRI